MTNHIYVSLLNEEKFDDKYQKVDVSNLKPNNKKCYFAFLQALYGKEEKFKSIYAEIDLESITVVEKALIDEALAVLAFYNKKYDEAITSAECALIKNPESAFSYFILANAHTLQRKYSEAIDYYIKGLEIIPDHQESIRNLITIYLSKGNLRKEAWEISNRLKPSLRTYLYKALIKLGWGSIFNYFAIAILFLLFLFPISRLPTVIILGTITFVLEVGLLIFQKNERYLLRYILGYQMIASSELLLAVLIWLIFIK
jgi:tetratricopeptide (TPR) repeat protein